MKAFQWYDAHHVWLKLKKLRTSAIGKRSQKDKSTMLTICMGHPSRILSVHVPAKYVKGWPLHADLMTSSQETCIWTSIHFQLAI